MLSYTLQSNSQDYLKQIYGITTVYNEELTLHHIALSIVNWHEKGRFGNALKKWIFVDDGSTDNSSEILERYAAKYPFIELITLPENCGKGWAYRKAAEWLLKQYKTTKEAVIVQLDSDLIGIRPRDIDALVGCLVEQVKLGSYSGPRLSCLALVPSPHRYGVRKFIREKIGYITSRKRLAITGQRAYFCDVLYSVIPEIEPTTGFGLEALLNAEVIARFNEIKNRHGIRQRSELIKVMRWEHVKHVSFVEKLGSKQQRDPLTKLDSYLNIVKHYFLLFLHICSGVIKGFGVSVKRKSQRLVMRRGNKFI